jgi:hypothetical protein
MTSPERSNKYTLHFICVDQTVSKAAGLLLVYLIGPGEPESKSIPGSNRILVDSSRYSKSNIPSCQPAPFQTGCGRTGHSRCTAINSFSPYRGHVGQPELHLNPF